MHPHAPTLCFYVSGNTRNDVKHFNHNASMAILQFVFWMYLVKNIDKNTSYYQRNNQYICFSNAYGI